MMLSKVIWFRVVWMSCAECAMTEPMQPCEACPNYNVQKAKQKC